MNSSGSLEARDTIHSIVIRRAVAIDLESLLPLFQEYLQFYALGRSVSNIEKFLKDRLDRQDTIILIA